MSVKRPESRMDTGCFLQIVRISGRLTRHRERSEAISTGTTVEPKPPLEALGIAALEPPETASLRSQ